MVVTGGASGIGAACMDWWRDRDGIAVGLDVDGSAPDVTSCDVTSEEDVTTALKTVRETHGRIDAIVHCAGVLGPQVPLVELTLADWERVMAVHATAGFLLAKHGIPVLAENGGALVFTGSIVTSGGSATHPAYAAGKAALVNLARSLAGPAGRHRVRVNVVSPGSVVGTKFLREERPDGLSLVEVAGLAASIPMGRAGTGADIAATVGFLASPEARHITGADIVVDGGEGLPNRGAGHIMPQRSGQ